MKKIFIAAIVILMSLGHLNAQTGKKALLIIDIQDFYFPGGKAELVEPEKAATNAALLLENFRQKHQPVIYIRHNYEPGGKINNIVKPISGEKIFSKDEVNSFLHTGLRDYLTDGGIDTLVICGMQTHMCVEAATRAASDFGYKCILIDDACATRDLRYGDRIIKAADVHYSTLSTLKSYAEVESTNDYLKRGK
ncbi:MAG TPA: cysteine hydrolase family protein [Bacteroidales bacterium]|nr:cysteine hydrolase family protein [Bacteroidales bacterium]